MEEEWELKKKMGREKMTDYINDNEFFESEESFDEPYDEQYDTKTDTIKERPVYEGKLICPQCNSKNKKMVCCFKCWGKLWKEKHQGVCKHCGTKTRGRLRLCPTCRYNRYGKW